jgi:acyl-coenzyme A synthetase/AMP-(fatty) acid ligase
MGALRLSDLFLGGTAATQPVALDGDTVRTWEDFRLGAAGVADQVRLAGGERWVLACEGAWAFAVGLFGLLLAERTVVLPPNTLPGTLDAFRAGAGGMLLELPPPGTALAPAALDGRIEFWTSGTTGEPKAILKDFAQLEAEVAMLEAVFGDQTGPGPMVSTVPHHHIYGCLFRILWPLAAGRPFLCEPCGDPAGFRAACALAPVLVSSPAHLSRLPRLMDLSLLPGLPAAIFSSGGPLGEAEALAWRRWVPGGVVEIYGSTETGGIAWRRQDGEAASALWTPLPDVAIDLDTDGALVVTSFRAGPGPVRMEDAAEWAGHGRFRLLGRLDRTIKLEEKRVSLPELEAALEQHPLVAKAAVTLLEAHRPTLAAAVVLKNPPDLPRLQLVKELRRHLARRFEPVALPRRWRFLEALPLDARGKLTALALDALFQAEASLP